MDPHLSDSPSSHKNVANRSEAGSSGRAAAADCRDVVFFWSAAILFAVTTWWPVGIKASSGLHGGDTYTYFFPLKAWYSDRLQDEEIALWNPLIGHGIPSLGESQTGVFYPFHLFFYRFLPLNTAYHANFLFHYVLAFGFSCHYARRLGLSRLESLLAAVVFTYGWFPARSCLEWAIITGAWLPLAFWGVESFLGDGRRRYLLATQIALAIQLLAGHFNIAFITVAGLVAYVALRMVIERRPWKRASCELVFIALTLVLAYSAAAVQLLPSWELKRRSQRAESAAFGEHQISYGAIPPSYLSQTLAPWRFYPYVNNPEFERAQFGENNTNKVEAHLYFGLVPMLLATVSLVACAYRTMRMRLADGCGAVWTWLVLGLASLSIATGFWTAWAVHLPGFGYFTGPGRYGILVQLSVAIMAGEGARQVRTWFESAGAHSRRMWVATISVCVILYLVAEYWMAWAGGSRALLAWIFPVRESWTSAFQWTIGCITAGGLVVLASAHFRVPNVPITLLCVILAWIDFVLVSRVVQYAEVREQSPILQRDESMVRAVLGDRLPLSRVMARNQNSVSLCGVATVPVYLGIGPREYFLGPLRIPDDFHWESRLSPATLRWLRWSGVTHILSFDPMDDDSLELIWAGEDPLLHGVLGRSPFHRLWLYAVRGSRGRAYWVAYGDAATVLDKTAADIPPIRPVAGIRQAANEITLDVECDTESVVVLTDLNYPGWEVRVDGHRAEAVRDTVFRAVRVEGGPHEIRWLYRPTSLKAGAVMSAAALIATMLCFLRRPLRWWG